MQGMEGNKTAGKGEQEQGPKDAAQEPLVYGPLDIKRYLKDDGRALILYMRREPAKT